MERKVENSFFPHSALIEKKRPGDEAILYTVLLFCVAIAARAPFEGVATFDSYNNYSLPSMLAWSRGYEHACSSRNSIMGGGSNIEGESLS